MTSQYPAFSYTILLTLAVVLGASMTMFFLLVRRWTTQRQWVTLAEWARAKQFRFAATEVEQLPLPLAPIVSFNVQIRLHLSGRDVRVLQIQTDPPAGGTEPQRWNVLVWRRPLRKAALAALRPAGVAASVFDLFGLSPFPALALGHRFTVLSNSAVAARALAESASRTLLPADIGLLLNEDWIVLDFSTRPFDPIELDRMIAVAQQLGQML